MTSAHAVASAAVSAGQGSGIVLVSLRTVWLWRRSMTSASLTGDGVSLVMNPLCLGAVASRRTTGIRAVSRNLDRQVGLGRLSRMELGVLGPLTVDGLVARMPRRDRVVL